MDQPAEPGTGENTVVTLNLKFMPEMHATSLLAAIDADIAGDPAYYGLLKDAAGHMPMTALALAGGIAADKGIQ